jgi:hypothetical protein
LTHREKPVTNFALCSFTRNVCRYTAALRRRLGNLALLCGMAHEMIGAHVPPHSLAEIHVNYPDPPEWVGSSQCLVDQPFLHAAHRSLRKGASGGGGGGGGAGGEEASGAAGSGGGGAGYAGHLTLVTDDPTYAMVGPYPKCHAQMLAKVPKIQPKYPKYHAQMPAKMAKVPKCPKCLGLSLLHAHVPRAVARAAPVSPHRDGRAPLPHRGSGKLRRVVL